MILEEEGDDDTCPPSSRNPGGCCEQFSAAELPDLPRSLVYLPSFCRTPWDHQQTQSLHLLHVLQQLAILDHRIPEGSPQTLQLHTVIRRDPNVPPSLLLGMLRAARHDLSHCRLFVYDWVLDQGATPALLQDAQRTLVDLLDRQGVVDLEEDNNESAQEMEVRIHCAASQNRVELSALRMCPANFFSGDQESLEIPANGSMYRWDPDERHFRGCFTSMVPRPRDPGAPY